MADVKRYKFQALVTLTGKKHPELAARFGPDPLR